MGNGHPSLGHIISACNCTDAIGYKETASFLINMHDIEPWDARALIKENLRKQAELAKRSPLKNIYVEDGMAFFRLETTTLLNHFSASLSREQFVNGCQTLLAKRGVALSGNDVHDLGDVFDSMDFDKNGLLSTGEWAAGLSVFFRGHIDKVVHSVFNVLDKNRNGTLQRWELKEYLSPFVKAMTPPDADPLRPLLLDKAVEELYTQMKLNKLSDITSEEMLAWTRRGYNIIDFLCKIIEKEVYQLWLEHSKRNHPHKWNQWHMRGDWHTHAYNKDRPMAPPHSHHGGYANPQITQQFMQTGMSQMGPMGGQSRAGVGFGSSIF